MIILPYMSRRGEQQHVTEGYVSVPPALTITDETGAIWTLGFRFGAAPRGEFAFNVLRNGLETGEVASRIERHQGRMRIFTAQGWKYLKTVQMDVVHVYGIGVRFRTPLVELPAAPAAVVVAVYHERRPDQAVVNFPCNPAIGGVWDGSVKPFACAPGEWLYATMTPALDATVMAYLGERYTREIPIHRGE